MAAALSLRTQYDNLGDEIINAILLKELAQRMPVLALGHAVPDWYLANLHNHLGPAWKTLSATTIAQRSPQNCCEKASAAPAIGCSPPAAMSAARGRIIAATECWR